MSTLPDRPIVIAGGSGFLGSALARHLTASGRAVIILSRSVPKNCGTAQHASWDARTVGDWRHALNGAAGVVNLVGRTVDCLKTPDHRDEIFRSRVESVNVLGEAMRSLEMPPPTWVQMSTAHIYGDPPVAVCDEESSFGYGFAPDVGRAWEAAFETNKLPSQRGVVFRTSFVVGRNMGSGGGALARLLTLAKLGLGGTVASGKQGMSWIHEADMNRLFERALLDPSMNGAYIASSPNPVSQQEFMHTLRRVVRMPIGLPAFTWMVRLGAPFFMRTDPELALHGRYVISKRLKAEGFQFRFPHLAEALADLLKIQP